MPVLHISTPYEHLCLVSLAYLSPWSNLPIGNILVRLVDSSGHVVSPLQVEGRGPLHERKPEPPLRTQLVLLDFGLAEELTPDVRHHFISFLNAICSGMNIYRCDFLVVSLHLPSALL